MGGEGRCRVEREMVEVWGLMGREKGKVEVELVGMGMGKEESGG